MRSVRVVVDTAEESRRSVLTDVLGEEVTSTGMLVNEGRNIVDVTSDNDQGTLQTLFLDYRRKSI